MKETVKKLLKQLNIAITKNQRYDKQTNQIIKKVCKSNSNCIDIGAHTGDVLNVMLYYAYDGVHYAFEPVPFLYERLWRKYQYFDNCKVYDVALSNRVGTSTFNYVMSNPSYSGLKRRKYDRKEEEEVTLMVKVEMLDNIIPKDHRVDLVKIDVEGAELLVLEGGIETIKRNRPLVIFEHGLGASDYYDSTPDKMYEYFSGCAMKISRLSDWLKGRAPLSKEKFIQIYKKNSDYYFIAHP